MGNKLFVGSLAWSLDDAGLAAAFAPFGNVREAKVITDRESGRSRGFGFVTFERSEDAKKAMESMDGQLISGRNVNVSEAKERERGGGGGGGGGNYGRGGGGGGGYDRGGDRGGDYDRGERRGRRDR